MRMGTVKVEVREVMGVYWDLDRATSLWCLIAGVLRQGTTIVRGLQTGKSNHKTYPTLQVGKPGLLV
jgi:hypothetical protein